MREFSYYHKRTGALHSRRCACNLADAARALRFAAANAPADHLAIAGRFDPLSQRIDVASGMVIDYQPPQPSPDHVWNAATTRWQLSAAAQQRQAMRDAALRRIAALEASQGRALREAAIGTSGAVEKLKALDAQIAELRQDLA
jgi:hypothetical protein